MKKPYEIIETVKSDQVPPPRGKKVDYRPLLKAVATLAAGECLKIHVEKPRQCEQVRQVIKNNFKANPHSVTRRTNPDGGFDVYITRNHRT